MPWPKSSSSRSGATAKCTGRSYARGIAQGPLEVVGATDKSGTTITFLPDDTIFETTEFSYDSLSQRFRELAFLNRGITISLVDERAGKDKVFHFEGGIVSFVEHMNRNRNALHTPAIYVEGKRRRHGVRDRDAVERRLSGGRVLVREHGKHPRRRHPLEWSSRRAHPLRQPIRLPEQPHESAPWRYRRRGHPRRVDRRHQHEDPVAAVRGADEDQARQHRSERVRREPSLPKSSRVFSKRTRPRRSASSPKSSIRREPGKRRAKREIWHGAKARSR